MTRTSSWMPLINNFHSNLSYWKARRLSVGGTFIICKVVLRSLGLYWFSLYKAPFKVINTIESIKAIFILERGYGQKENPLDYMEESIGS